LFDYLRPPRDRVGDQEHRKLNSIIAMTLLGVCNSCIFTALSPVRTPGTALAGGHRHQGFGSLYPLVTHPQQPTHSGSPGPRHHPQCSAFVGFAFLIEVVQRWSQSVFFSKRDFPPEIVLIRHSFSPFGRCSISPLKLPGA